MKQFDIEKAKAGAKVCTRDGRPARIICFDRDNCEYPIVALITTTNNGEYVLCCTKEGTSFVSGCMESDNDLFLAPTKREGWVNVYKVGELYYFGGLDSTEEKAMKYSGGNRIDTIHIEWEE